MAIADNRTSEVGLDWDIEALKELEQEGVGLDAFWFDDELTKFVQAIPSVASDSLPPIPDDKYSEQYGVIVLCDSEAHQQTVYEDLIAQGHSCRVVVT